MIRTTRSGPILVFISAILWASDAPFRVFLTEQLPSSFIILVEHSFDLLLISPLLYVSLKSIKSLSLKSWLAVIFIGVGGSALASLAFTQSFHYVTPSVAILLQKLQPLLVIGLASTILKERFGKGFWLWSMLALVGAYLISFSGFMPQLYDGEGLSPNLIGVSLAILAVIFWSGSTVLGRYALKQLDFKAMTSLRFVVGFIFLFGLNLFQGNLSLVSTVSFKSWVYLAIIAFTSGAVSLFIYYKGLQDTKASVATIAELGFPLGAVIINLFFLNEVLSMYQVIGVGVLLFSILMLTKQNQKNSQSRKNYKNQLI